VQREAVAIAQQRCQHRSCSSTCALPCPHLSLTLSHIFRLAKKKCVWAHDKTEQIKKGWLSRRLAEAKKSTCECAHVLGAQTASVKQGGTDNLACRSACHC
jgi:hypothetical protein